ncbi:glycosyltransferase family 39 protein [Arthrobacter sp. 2MCAF14]|uniref:glycosyltransferase family 39 protein n=1 Tax=Arthrobacter sp. 2MCAF14 TaxID=3232982 RepID=UPI003F8FA617
MPETQARPVLEAPEQAVTRNPPKVKLSTWIWLGSAVFAALVAGFIAPTLMPSRAFQILAAFGVFIAVVGARTTFGFYSELAGRIRGWREEPVRHHKLSAAPGLIFCGMLAFILLGVLFWPSPHIANYNYALTGCGALFVLFVLPPLYRASAAFGRRLETAPRWVRPAFLCVAMILALLVQLRLGYALQVMPGWDAGAVAESAFGVADGSKSTIYDYFNMYPNNLAITVALTRYSQVMVALGVPSGGLLYAAIVLNCVVLCTAILLTYLCARQLVNEGAAVFTLLPSALYLVLSPYISVVYSDSVGILFPVLLFYIHLKAVRAGRWQVKLVLWTLLGAVTAVGYNLKPTAAFATAAIVGVYALEYLFRNKSALHKLRALAGVLAATAIGFTATNTAMWVDIKAQSYVGFNVDQNTKAFPWTHFLMMGATGIGAFTQSDVNATAAIQDPTERYQHGLEVYAQRVADMGYPGYLQFIDRKAVWTFGDGSFHTWGEGLLLNQKDPFPIKDPLSNKIKDYLWGNGAHFDLMTGVWQSGWLALLFLVALPMRVRSPRLLTSSAAIMRWSLLALTLFLLFFETRPRYLYLYVPFFILLATLTLSALTTPAHGRRSILAATSTNPDEKAPLKL